MGYDLSKRLANIEKQTDNSRWGRLRLGRSLLLVVICFCLLFWLLKQLNPPLPEPTASDSSGPSKANGAPTDPWLYLAQEQVVERCSWLNSIPFFYFMSDLYLDAATSVLRDYQRSEGQRIGAESAQQFIDVSGWKTWAQQLYIGAYLRLYFVILSLVPLWIVGMVIGLFVGKMYVRKPPTEDFLGICDRGRGPFYSGIYGPLRANKSVSGTDYSCPSLACPAMEKRPVAVGHRLAVILSTYGALNETTVGLVQTILAYASWPAFTEDEMPQDAEIHDGEPVEDEEKVSFDNLFSNESGTIEERAVEGLPELLEAYRLTRVYHEELEREEKASGALRDFALYRTELYRVLEGASTLTRLICQSLTPSRARAFSRLPIQAIAASYLATEAGKALVYKKAEKGFARISRFPHLQARAVLQSLVAYHREFDGDMRLVMRQAILCSRRHGNFGRSFLPIRMPVESRALRDVLEIMYAEPARRVAVGQLVELDANMEEVSINWRQEFTRGLRKEAEMAKNGAPDRPLLHRLWKGIPHKSVVLMPLTDLVKLALKGIDESRLDHVSELIVLTRQFQTGITVSARLPGFKRQADEADRGGLEASEITQAIADGENHQVLLQQWLIVRRMLTRYNWLSTRVGDDSVPASGFVHATMIVAGENGRPDALGLQSLVPLRQRRYKELFGTKWEVNYYGDSPPENDIEVFVDTAEFHTALRKRMGEAVSGRLDSRPIPPSAFETAGNN